MRTAARFALAATATVLLAAASRAVTRAPEGRRGPTTGTVIGRCGSFTGPAGGFSIAVLGDGFTADEQGVLQAASDDLLCNGAMALDPVLSRLAPHIPVSTIAVESDSDEIARPGEVPHTRLGVIYNGEHGNCFFTVTSDAHDVIADIATAAAHSHVVVIVNIPGQDAGCTRGGITYVTTGARWQTLAHEIGHMARLNDEYVDQAGAATLPSGDRSNCAENTPWWIGSVPGAATIGGCNRFMNLWKGFDHCRMNDVADDFCAVCDQVLAQYVSRHSSGPTQPAVDVAVELQSSPDGTTDVRMTEAQADVPEAVIPSRVRANERTALVLVDGRPVAADMQPGTFDRRNQLVGRAYGGMQGGTHDIRPTDRATVFVRLPGTRASLRDRNVQVQLVDPTLPPPANPAQFTAYLQQLATLPAAGRPVRIQIR